MSGRVLIVEDEHHLAEGLCFNLEAEGYQAEVVDTGEKALARLIDEQARFDLVVLDDQDAAAHACAIGRSSVNVLPQPWPALSANARPPCFFATDRTMNNPSPVPFVRTATLAGIR